MPSGAVIGPDKLRATLRAVLPGGTVAITGTASLNFGLSGTLTNSAAPTFVTARKVDLGPAKLLETRRALAPSPNLTSTVSLRLTLNGTLSAFQPQVTANITNLGPGTLRTPFGTAHFAGQARAVVFGGPAYITGIAQMRMGASATGSAVIAQLSYQLRPGPGLMEPFNPNQFVPTRLAFNAPGPQFLMAARGQAVASAAVTLSSLNPLQAFGGAVASASVDLQTLKGSGGKAYRPAPGPGISPSLRDMFRPLVLSTRPAFQTFTPSASGSAPASGSANLTTGVRLAAGAQAPAVAAVDLTTSIQPAAAGTAVASATVALSGSIQFNAVGTAPANASVNLVTGIVMQAAGLSLSYASAALPGMTLSVTAQGIASGTSALTTGLLVAAQGSAPAIGAVALSTGITYLASGVAPASASVTLVTASVIQASGIGLAQASVALTTASQLAAAGSAPAQASVTLSTSLLFAASGPAMASASADLETFVTPWAANGIAPANAQAQMTFGIDLAASGGAVASATVGLRTVLQPPGEFADIRWVLAPRGWREPYGEFFQRPGEVLWYGIDWEDWLANRWEPNSAADLGLSIRPTLPNGYEFICTAAGDTGAFEPTWPNFQGAVVMDGSAVWTALPVSIASLEDGIDSTDTSQPDLIGVNSNQVQDNRSYLRVDTTRAVSGTNYDVLITVDTTGGQQKIAKIRIKVR